MSRTRHDGAPSIEVHGHARQPLGMSSARFLRDYWQRRPLLIRGALADLRLPLTADDLAGLACEEAALSRIVRRDVEHDRWTVKTGPFDESTFAALSDRDWTLLVQDVDKWDVDVAALLDHFTFLPSWRIDDVMVSYAEDGGGVGAHSDQYDVFLLQGLGARHWAIDSRADAPQAFRADAELKLLRRFDPTHEWTLQPGDMLYLPPGIAHNGVAMGACMTFSIGMRAPASGELLLDFAEHLAGQMPESQRYTDVNVTPVRHTGEIDAAALNRVDAALGPTAAALGKTQRAEWFGRFITRYRSAQVVAPPPRAIGDAALARALAAGATLLRHPWSRLAWTRHHGAATLFFGGCASACPLALAQRLCAERALAFPTPPAATELAVLGRLVNAGHLLLRRAARR